jgi:hypothetical protein
LSRTTGHAVACDERTEQLNHRFKQSAHVGKKPLTAKSMQRHSVNATFADQAMDVLREAMDTHRPTSHRQSGWSKEQQTMVQRYIESLTPFDYTPGRKLPPGFVTRPDLAETLAIRATAEWLPSFLDDLRQNKQVLWAADDPEFDDIALMFDESQ